MERGFQVPKDFNVIGIDNVELSKHHSIALTTVGLTTEENLGFMAIEKLFEIMEKKVLASSKQSLLNFSQEIQRVKMN